MMRLRHLRLRAFTSKSTFGVDIPFASGLNIIQAPNTSGKSTCLQAIIYALGLERALGPQLTIPLPYAMRERIHAQESDEYEVVLQSFVELEIENGQSDILVVHRDVIGGKNTKLVQTWVGPKLSRGIASGDQQDFFVHDRGSAVNESGFHTFLAKFVGWNLPPVTRFDGTECLLYMEVIFPMIFVEQKRGWSAIQGPFPSFFSIQDTARRVMEFLLDLEVAKNRRRRTELRAVINDLTRQWHARRETFEETASLIGRVRGIPSSPTPEFAQQPQIELQLYYQDEWKLLVDAINIIDNQITELDVTKLQTVDEASPGIEARIEILRFQIDEQSAGMETVRNEFSLETQDNKAIETRIGTLETDLRRNQDAQRLQTLGSELGTAATDKICPTCHQGVSSELLPSLASVSMAIDENISFIKSQLELYKSSLGASNMRLQETAARYRAIDRDLRGKQKELRALRQDLSRPSSATSRASIEQIVRLQAYRDRLQSVLELSDSLTDELKQISSDWAESMSVLRGLPSDELTVGDNRKIIQLEETIRRELAAYGFRSFQPSEICLSKDNFRPLFRTKDRDETIEREISFEISASDAIRLKWAYYVAALSLKSTYITNHLSLLVFDEPGQQEMEAKSLAAFLAEATRIAGHESQIIVSTSEAVENMTSALGIIATLITFPGFILQPIAL